MGNTTKIDVSKLSDTSKKVLHELGLEGIEVSSELLEDMKRLDDETITMDEFINRAIKRATSDE